MGEGFLGCSVYSLTAGFHSVQVRDLKTLFGTFPAWDRVLRRHDGLVLAGFNIHYPGQPSICYFLKLVAVCKASRPSLW